MTQSSSTLSLLPIVCPDRWDLQWAAIRAWNNLRSFFCCLSSCTRSGNEVIALHLWHPIHFHGNRLPVHRNRFMASLLHKEKELISRKEKSHWKQQEYTWVLIEINILSHFLFPFKFQSTCRDEIRGCTNIFVISDALCIAIRTRSERCYFKAPFYLTSSSFSIFIFSFWLSQDIQVTKQASFPTFHLNLSPVIHFSSQNPLQHYSSLVSFKDPLQVSVLILHPMSFILVYQKALRYTGGSRGLSY